LHFIDMDGLASLVVADHNNHPGLLLVVKLFGPRPPVARFAPGGTRLVKMNFSLVCGLPYWNQEILHDVSCHVKTELPARGVVGAKVDSGVNSA